MVMHNEEEINFRFPVCSVVAGKRIETQVIISDLSGMSLSTVDRNAYSLLKLTAQSGGDYYPEVLGPYIVVNCPSFFSFIWAILKGLVDEKTRQKFKLLGSEY